MKRYPQPLSEDFVYSSPERMPGGSFRWVRGNQKRQRMARKDQQEVAHGSRNRH
jgi:hypothetical protein